MPRPGSKAPVAAIRTSKTPRTIALCYILSRLCIAPYNNSFQFMLMKQFFRDKRILALVAISIPSFCISIEPAQAGCQNVQGSYGSQYYICRMGSTVSLQGSNLRTGSFWSESCYGVDKNFGGCSGTDANGNYWSCNWSPYNGRNCYSSEIMN